MSFTDNIVSKFKTAYDIIAQLPVEQQTDEMYKPVFINLSDKDFFRFASKVPDIRSKFEEILISKMKEEWKSIQPKKEKKKESSEEEKGETWQILFERNQQEINVPPSGHMRRESWGDWNERLNFEDGINKSPKALIYKGPQIGSCPELDADFPPLINDPEDPSKTARCHSYVPKKPVNYNTDKAKTTTCELFFAGLCVKGENCWFLHKLGNCGEPINWGPHKGYYTPCKNSKRRYILESGNWTCERRDGNDWVYMNESEYKSVMEHVP